MNSCPDCKKPYGLRRRCYFCTGRKRTGEIRKCAICKKKFYAARWQLEDTTRKQGTYCSKECRVEAIRLVGPGASRKMVSGYIQIYYPSHPDAPKCGWMLEHRLIAEKKLGRRLKANEQVHHRNRKKDDNRPENLRVMLAGDHTRLTNRHNAKRYKADMAELAEYRKRYGPLILTGV